MIVYYYNILLLYTMISMIITVIICHSCYCMLLQISLVGSGPNGSAGTPKLMVYPTRMDDLVGKKKHFRKPLNGQPSKSWLEMTKGKQ